MAPNALTPLCRGVFNSVQTPKFINLSKEMTASEFPLDAQKVTDKLGEFKSTQNMLTGNGRDMGLVGESANENPGTVKTSELAELQRHMGILLKNDACKTLTSGLISRWSEYLGSVALDKGAMVDINALVQQVLRDAYMENTEDLHFYAQKVKFFNEVKKKMRAELTRARDTLVSVAGAEDTAAVSFNPKEIQTTYYGEDTSQDVADTTPAAPISTPVVEEAETLTFWKDESQKVQDMRVGLVEEYHDSTDYDVFDQHRNAFLQNMVHDLPSDPRQRAALAEYWQENGFVMQMNCKETDKKDNQYFQNGTGKLSSYWDQWGWDRDKFAGESVMANIKSTMAGTTAYGAGKVIYDGIQANDPDAVASSGTKMLEHESLEEFVQRAVEQQSDDFRESVRAKEGSINVHSLHYRTDIPMFAVSTSLEEAEAGSAQAQLLSEQGYSAQTQPSAHSLSAGAGDLTDSSDVSTKAGLDTYIQKLEEKLNSVGDDAQLANVDLQNMLQKQQQTLQMMSNIGKMLHDTAMAIIRKIGG